MKYRLLTTSALTFFTVFASAIPAVFANPEGGVVVGGEATISEAGKKLDVHQHTDRTVIDWRSFDIDVDEHTQFHQPSSSATALNRVNSADPSQILGKLSANGNIILVNPNGVFFGQDSRVDVNGIVATSANIDTQDFMQGGNDFNKTGNPKAAIINKGLITAKEAGLVGLVAPNVLNNGVIQAKTGRVQLSSGDAVTLDFYGDGLLKVRVEDENLKSQIVGNTGILSAQGGTIAMTAAAARDTVNALIVSDGTLDARSVSNQGGRILIGASGANKTDKSGASYVSVRGTLDASGRDSGEKGGKIEILGDHIELTETAFIDVSGHSAAASPARDNAGSASLTDTKQVRSEEAFLAQDSRAGGSIKIGGDYLGQGDTQTATTVSVAKGALIVNDAVENGDGGRTIIWSDDTTEFSGLVVARGGAEGGDGGFLETSGKKNLKAQGYADLTARADGYDKGTYLLDPANITIYGNVDENFQSTDGSVDLTNSQVLNADFSDSAQRLNHYDINTPNGSFANGATVASGSVTRNANAHFRLDVTIPGSPAGTIYEQGGTGQGVWVGFLADGTLVFHAGTGSSFINTTSAHLEIAPGSAPTGAGTLSWEIDVAGNTIIAFWNNVEIGRNTATSNFTQWAGTDNGRVGAISNSVVSGANTANFNGTITGSLKYFNKANASSSEIADQSGSGNKLTIDTFEANVASNAFGTVDGVIVNNNQRYIVANTTDINDGARGAMGRTITFKTDADVTSEQIIYKEGGGTNSYLAYIESGILNVVFYNNTGAQLTSRQFAVDPNKSYTMTSVFDATTNDFTVQVNGEVMSGTALGVGADFLSHTGAINFGASDSSLRDEMNNVFTPVNTVSTFGQAIFYDRYLNETDRALIDQYQSTKFGIALTGPGTGGTEVAQATASDGFGVFTTDYLERLSATADIALVANNAITFDLKGDTLNLTADRSISMTATNGSITDLSAGTIRATRTAAGGNITLSAGGAGDIILDTTNLEALSGGLVSLSAGGDINIAQTSALNLGSVSGSSVNLRTTGAASDITVNGIVTATDIGNALVLASGNDFINTVGAGALSAANGRWLVYSTDPADNTRNALLPDASDYNKTFAGNAPATIGAGNRFIFSRVTAPTITYDVDDDNVEYGDAYAGGSLTYNTGLVASDTIANIGQSGAATFSGYTVGDNAGTYVNGLSGAVGTLSNALGYQYSFNTGDLTVDKATLNASLLPSVLTRTEGEPNPVFNISYSGFKLGETVAVIDTPAAASTLATPASGLGTYPITIFGGIDNNYNFSYTPGTLQILEAIADPSIIPSTVEQNFAGNVAQQNESFNLFNPTTPTSNIFSGDMDIEIEQDVPDQTGAAKQRVSSKRKIKLRIKEALANFYDLKIKDGTL